MKLNPYKPKYIPVECDEDGLIPEMLKKSLESKWKPGTQLPNSDIPKV